MNKWRSFLTLMLLAGLILVPVNLEADTPGPRVEEFVREVVQALDIKPPEEVRDIFRDIPDQYAPYIDAAEQKGLISEDILPLIGDPLTREKAVTIMMRSLQDREVDETVLDKFTDAGEITPELKPYMARAVATGFLAGYPDKRLAPGEILSGEQMEILLRRFNYVIRAHPLIEGLELK